MTPPLFTISTIPSRRPQEPTIGALAALVFGLAALGLLTVQATVDARCAAHPGLGQSSDRRIPGLDLENWTR